MSRSKMSPELQAAIDAVFYEGVKITGELPSAPSSRSRWPKDPFVLHTQYYPAYHRLRKAAAHNPQAREYLQNAPGPKFMRRMTVVKTGLVLLLSAFGLG